MTMGAFGWKATTFSPKLSSALSKTVLSWTDPLITDTTWWLLSFDFLGSNCNVFQKSIFSDSNHFTKSNAFNPTNKFTKSNIFGDSKLFSISYLFFASHVFSDSLKFNNSSYFSQSNFSNNGTLIFHLSWCNQISRSRAFDKIHGKKWMVESYLFYLYENHYHKLWISNFKGNFAAH